MRARIFSPLLILLALLYISTFNHTLVAQSQVREDLETAFWRNNEPNRAMFSKLFIDMRKFHITAYESCLSGDCAWASKSMRHRNGLYEVTFRDGTAVFKLTLQKTSENELRVLTRMRYWDSRDWDVWEYSFSRSDELGAGGGISNK